MPKSMPHLCRTMDRANISMRPRMIDADEGSNGPPRRPKPDQCTRRAEQHNHPITIAAAWGQRCQRHICRGVAAADMLKAERPRSNGRRARWRSGHSVSVITDTSVKRKLPRNSSTTKYGKHQRRRRSIKSRIGAPNFPQQPRDDKEA